MSNLVFSPLLSLSHYYIPLESFQNEWPWRLSAPQSKEKSEPDPVAERQSRRMTYVRASSRIFQGFRSLGGKDPEPEPPLSPASKYSDFALPSPEVHAVQFPPPTLSELPPLSQPLPKPHHMFQGKLNKSKISLPSTYVPRSRFSQDSVQPSWK